MSVGVGGTGTNRTIKSADARQNSTELPVGPAHAPVDRELASVHPSAEAGRERGPLRRPPEAHLLPWQGRSIVAFLRAHSGLEAGRNR